jgi:hypothetical protein
MTDPRTRPNPGPRSYERPQSSQIVPARLPRPALEARARRGKPESNAVRMVLGLAGLASASALATAMLPSILPQPMAATGADTAAADPAQQPDPSVIHVTRVVQLAPGQTLPPDVAAAANAPAATPTPKPTARPTPRIIYQTVTRQSGKP